MKLHKICAICFLVFMLSGCAMMELLSDMAQESSKPPLSESESVSVSEPARSAPENQPSISAGSVPEPEPSGISPALEGILAEAPQDCVLAIVRLPDASRFATLEKPSFSMDLSKDYPGQISETVLIVPLIDGISVSVERYEVHYTLPWTTSNQVLYQMDGKVGEVYALHTLLAEGVPDVMVTARIDGKKTEWVCMMDGMGGMEVEYTWPPAAPREETFLSAPYIYALSGAAAACRLAYGDGGIWETADDGFWETVAYAIAETETEAEYGVFGDFRETEEGMKITLSRDRFSSYVETLFPGMTAWPPWEESAVEAYFSYNAAEETYEILYFDLPESINWWYPSDDAEDADGKGGWVAICVFAPGKPNGQTYEVVWREKMLRGENDPIAYEIVEIRETQTVYGVG